MKDLNSYIFMAVLAAVNAGIIFGLYKLLEWIFKGASPVILLVSLGGFASMLIMVFFYSIGAARGYEQALSDIIYSEKGRFEKILFQLEQFQELVSTTQVKLNLASFAKHIRRDS